MPFCEPDTVTSIRDSVGHQQRGVTGRVDGLTHFVETRETAGRRLVVHYADGFDLLVRVFAQFLLDGVGIGTRTPIGRDDFRLETEAARHGFPQHGELARFAHQHLVARRQRVGEASFPSAGTRRRINDDVALRLEQAFDATEHAAAKFAKLQAAMIENLTRHGRQNPLRNGGRPRDLQKVAAGAAVACRHSHSPQRVLLLFVSAGVLVPNRSGYNWPDDRFSRPYRAFCPGDCLNRKKWFLPVMTSTPHARHLRRSAGGRMSA